MTTMTNNTIIPKPWRQVGLTVLPGLLFFTSAVLRYAYVWLTVSSLAAIILPLLAAVWIVTRGRSLSKLPVWSMMQFSLIVFWFFIGAFELAFAIQGTLVYLVCLGTLGVLLLLLLKRSDIVRTPAWGLIAVYMGVILFQALSGGFRPRYYDYLLMILLPISVGLFLAREHGLYASLIVLPIAVVSMTIDIEPAIYFWEARAWVTVIDASFPLLFLVLAPLWVLRSRSVLGQAAGILVPIVIYYVGFVSTLSLVAGVGLSRGSSVLQACTIAEPVVLLFILMALVCALYGWGLRQNLPSANPTRPNLI